MSVAVRRRLYWRRLPGRGDDSNSPALASRPAGTGSALASSRARIGAQPDRVLIELPHATDLSNPADVNQFLSVLSGALAPGIAIVVVDLAPVVAWDLAALASISTACHAFARSGVELRLVVWSSELFGELQTSGFTTDGAIYASVDLALREPSASKNPCHG